MTTLHALEVGVEVWLRKVGSLFTTELLLTPKKGMKESKDMKKKKKK